MRTTSPQFYKYSKINMLNLSELHWNLDAPKVNLVTKKFRFRLTKNHSCYISVFRDKRGACFTLRSKQAPLACSARLPTAPRTSFLSQLIRGLPQYPRRWHFMHSNLSNLLQMVSFPEHFFMIPSSSDMLKGPLRLKMIPASWKSNQSVLKEWITLSFYFKKTQWI